MKKHLLLFAMLLLTVAVIGQREPFEIKVMSLPPEGGAVTGGGFYDPNVICTLTATANENYKFVNWTRAGDTLSLSEATTYSFSVTDTATFIANFMLSQMPTYTVDVAEIEHAQIDAVPNENVPEGQIVQVTISDIEAFYELEAGSLKYHFAGEDFPIESVGDSYLFEMPASDVTITACFVKRKHHVSVDPGIVNGSISVSPLGEVEIGADVDVTAFPDEGFRLDSIFFFDPDNGLHRIENGTFQMPDYDLSVRAAFSERGHRINVVILPPDTGTVAVDPNNAEQGETVTITVEPDLNYTIESVSAYYTSFFSQHDIHVNQLSHNVFAFEMVDHDVTVKVNFKLIDTPIISEIVTPDPICSGDSLQLVTPDVTQANWEEWQIAPDDSFEAYIAYTGQYLDANYNGWYLRYMATNEAGTTYSDVTTITVYPLMEENEIVGIVGKKCGTNKEHILVYPIAGLHYQWYYGNSPIPAETAQYIHRENGLTAGVYKVEVSHAIDDNGLRCSVFSEEYEVKEGFFINPNYAKSGTPIFVENNGENEGWLTIYSIDGRMMHSQWLDKGQNVVSFNLKAGIYVFSIANSQGTTTEKVIIQ